VYKKKENTPKTKKEKIQDLEKFGKIQKKTKQKAIYQGAALPFVFWCFLF